MNEWEKSAYGNPEEYVCAWESADMYVYAHI